MAEQDPRAVDSPREVSQADVVLAYKQVFSTQEGSIVLHDLLRRFGFTRRTTFDPEPARHAFNEGQRVVLVHMGRMIDADTAEVEELRKGQGEL